MNDGHKVRRRLLFEKCHRELFVVLLENKFRAIAQLQNTLGWSGRRWDCGTAKLFNCSVTFLFFIEEFVSESCLLAAEVCISRQTSRQA